MAQYTLTYFNFPGGRGEDCRLALHIAGADFEDDRVDGKDWPGRKPSTPFGAMPVLQVEGRGTLAHSNAILAYLGRELGLLPTDAFEQAQHLSVLESVEELRSRIQSTFAISDEAERKQVREEITEGPLRAWAHAIEAQLGDGPFFAGSDLSVADLKLMVLLKWFVTGGVDHVPTDCVADCPKLMKLYETVKAHPKVDAWYERWGKF